MRLFALLSLALSSVAAGCASRTGWTCAAHCITEYSCQSNGDSSWESELVTSAGPTAASAYQALTKQCKQSSTMLVTHMDCTGGGYEPDGASIATACGPN
jgi:hypothetical protein